MSIRLLLAGHDPAPVPLGAWRIHATRTRQLNLLHRKPRYRPLCLVHGSYGLSLVVTRSSVTTWGLSLFGPTPSSSSARHHGLPLSRLLLNTYG